MTCKSRRPYHLPGSSQWVIELGWDRIRELDREAAKWMKDHGLSPRDE
jgi:hypothetical protein